MIQTNNIFLVLWQKHSKTWTSSMVIFPTKIIHLVWGSYTFSNKKTKFVEKNISKNLLIWVKIQIKLGKYLRKFQPIFFTEKVNIYVNSCLCKFTNCFGLRVLWFARHGLQIAMELLRAGDLWNFEIARNPVFSRRKCLPPSIGKTLSVRRVRFSFVARSSGPHSQRWAGEIFESLNALCQCVWWSSLAFSIGMAAFMFVLDLLADVFLLWFARHG